MAVRKKRSIASGPTYSAWLAAIARKEFLIRGGLAGVAQFEREHGPFRDAEVAEAETWADDAIRRSRRSGSRRHRNT